MGPKSNSWGVREPGFRHRVAVAEEEYLTLDNQESLVAEPAPGLPWARGTCCRQSGTAPSPAGSGPGVGSTPESSIRGSAHLLGKWLLGLFQVLYQYDIFFR